MIASVTKPFCGNCTRARLSTDGKVFTCLFASEGISLRDPMRDGADDLEMEELISSIWRQRTDRYSEERTDLAPVQNRQAKVEMFRIGG